MSIILLNLKNELYKLSVKKKYLVFLIIGMMICSVNIIATWAIQMLSRGAVTVAPSGISMNIFPFFAELFVPLIVLMATCDLFSTEFNDLTIKAILMRPISRFKILTSKVLAILALAGIYYITIYLNCTILEIIFGNRSNIDIVKPFIAYIINIIPMINVILFSVFINMIFKSTTLTMFICIVIYAFMKYCSYFVPGIGSVLFTSYMQWHRLWVGNTLPFGALISKVGIVVGTGAILFTGSYSLFDKKEF